jgi:hypothetical protein
MRYMPDGKSYHPTINLLFASFAQLAQLAQLAQYMFSYVFSCFLPFFIETASLFISLSWTILFNIH